MPVPFERRQQPARNHCASSIAGETVYIIPWFEKTHFYDYIQCKHFYIRNQLEIIILFYNTTLFAYNQLLINIPRGSG